jgi:hypothetical protein
MMEVTRKGVNPLKTVEEIIAYLELELADAYEQHDLAEGRERLIHLIRATTILNLLEAIKGK